MSTLAKRTTGAAIAIGLVALLGGSIEAKMDAEGEAFDAQHGSIDWPPYPGDWTD